MAVNVWTRLLVGLALPLLAISQLERRARRCALVVVWTPLMSMQQQNTQQMRHIWCCRFTTACLPACREYKERLAAALDQQLPHAMQAQGPEELPMLPITGAWLGDAILLSGCAWQAAALLSDFLAPT